MEERQEIINDIRAFNRFYTVLLGFLNRNYLDSEYSLTETRIMFELRRNEQMSANRIIEMLHLDKGYVSRIIRNFEKQEMVVREVDANDRRAFVIRLTEKGRRAAEQQIERANCEIANLIEPFSEDTCRELSESMKKIIKILSDYV